MGKVEGALLECGDAGFAAASNSSDSWPCVRVRDPALKGATMPQRWEAIMAFSRREFVRLLGAGGAAVASSSKLIAYGREEGLAFAGFQQGSAQAGQRPATTGSAPIRLSSNENLRGPSPKVIAALKAAPSRDLGLGYPPVHIADFQEAIANMWGAKPQNVLMATGSGAELVAGVMAFCQAEKPLVTADPSYGAPAQTAQRQKFPIKPIALDGRLFLDLDRLISASSGAGLVFLCNPNNPSSTIHSQVDVEAAVRRIKERSPTTAILIDEAYIDYATAPGVGTVMKVALDLPDVFVTRTFSKAYGMAGMRMGYAIGQPETLRKLSSAWGLGDTNELQAVAGIAALADQEHMAWEKQENKRVRDYTTAEFQKMGFQVADSQTNFIFVNIGRPAAQFRDACRELGVAVGRDFPPMEKTWARISLGRMEDMEKAVPVFRKVLGKA
jgi:histidinol-phosphate aminotransferase